MLGHYDQAIKEMPNMEADPYSWDDNYTVLWIVRAYIEMAGYDKVIKDFLKYRYFPKQDALLSGHKFHLIGNYHAHQGDFFKAEMNYHRAREIYKKHEYELYTNQLALLELRCKLIQKKISPAEATKTFDEITSHASMRKYFYLWNTQMMSFFFARHGCNIRFKPSEDFNPMDCNASYLRMQMFVEKIKWLRHIGKNDAAEQLKEQYLKHRQEMAFYVPSEYKKSYLEHPFYQV